MDFVDIIKVVNEFFTAVDERRWDDVVEHFGELVYIDYSSMGAGSASSIPATEIVSSWKSILPGFDATHHQIGNHLVSFDGDFAKCKCYVTANHYLKHSDGGDVWTVVGTYDLELVRVVSYWNIVNMKFNLKFTAGNQNLPNLAKENLK